MSTHRCFFDGQGCAGKVELVQPKPGFSVKVVGYCARHREANLQSARWSGITRPGSRVRGTVWA